MGFSLRGPQLQPAADRDLVDRAHKQESHCAKITSTRKCGMVCGGVVHGVSRVVFICRASGVWCTGIPQALLRENFTLENKSSPDLRLD